MRRSMDTKMTGSHNRARTRDLEATYTNGQKRYLSAVGCDYEPNKLCYVIWIYSGIDKMVIF